MSYEVCLPRVVGPQSLTFDKSQTPGITTSAQIRLNTSPEENRSFIRPIGTRSNVQNVVTQLMIAMKGNNRLDGQPVGSSHYHVKGGDKQQGTAGNLRQLLHGCASFALDSVWF